MIVRGEVPGQIVLTDYTSVAFLDSRPLFPGHCLLVPRIHYETLADLPPELVAPLFRNAQLLSEAVEEALEAEGSFVAINNRVSQSIPHLHIHILPRRKKDGLKGFFWPRNPYPNDESALKVRDSIRSALLKLNR
jgi:histidine triad (HIT) family protein